MFSITVKANEQFKNYSLAKLVRILKSHKDEVTKEAKLISGVGSLTLATIGDKQKKSVDDDY